MLATYNVKNQTYSQIFLDMNTGSQKALELFSVCVQDGLEESILLSRIFNSVLKTQSIVVVGTILRTPNKCTRIVIDYLSIKKSWTLFRRNPDSFGWNQKSDPFVDIWLIFLLKLKHNVMEIDHKWMNKSFKTISMKKIILICELFKEV